MKMVDKLVWVANGDLSDSFMNKKYLRGAPKPTTAYDSTELSRQGIAGFYEWRVRSSMPIIIDMQVQEYLPKELFEI